MIDDVLTIARKELLEIFVQRSSLTSGVLRWIAVPLLIVGVWLPVQFGTEWVTGNIGLLWWIWCPPIMMCSVVADAFAGERERHTLETLLSTRLSDSAILYGKIAGSMAYGWGLTLIGLLFSIIAVNVSHWTGHILMFEAPMLAGTLLLSLLVSAMTSGGGVLLSLRAKSVRDAQQTLSICFMVVFFGIAFGLKSLPEVWRNQLSNFLVGSNLLMIGTGAGLLLLAIDAVLILAARARFQRAKLALD